MEVESVDSGKVDEAARRRGHRGREGQHADRAGAGRGRGRAGRAAGQGRAGRTAPRSPRSPGRMPPSRRRRCRAVEGSQGTRRAEVRRRGRSRSARRRRDGRDDRPPGAQRGDGRGAAPRQGRLRHGRGGRRVSGRLQDHPGPAAGIRPAAHRRYADHRARLCRPRRRRGVRGAAADRRVHDLELCHAGDRPDHQLAPPSSSTCRAGR